MATSQVLDSLQSGKYNVSLRTLKVFMTFWRILYFLVRGYAYTAPQKHFVSLKPGNNSGRMQINRADIFLVLPGVK